LKLAGGYYYDKVQFFKPCSINDESNSFLVMLKGATENAGVENAIWSKIQDGKIQEYIG